jgi:UDP-glucose 6-dehydrogenase
MSQLCEKTGADVNAVAKGMGMDKRIGNKFLHAGPGYGGSCFPKDTLALSRMAQEHGVSSRIVEAVVEVNASQKARMVAKIRDRPGRLRGRQAHRRARPDLQAGDRRHARCTGPGDTAGARGSRAR